VLTTAVVVLTLVVQGLSLAGVVKRSGLAVEPEHTEREQARTRGRLARAGLDHLDQLADLESVTEAAVTRVRAVLTARLDHDHDTPADSVPDSAELLASYRGLRREVIALQVAELRRLYDEHQVSDTTRRNLQHDLDLEDAAMGAT
jgi:NhaP-type Na+/H+ or K+/H+ antiporter